jgi:hypothetical protein
MTGFVALQMRGYQHRCRHSQAMRRILAGFPRKGKPHGAPGLWFDSRSSAPYANANTKVLKIVLAALHMKIEVCSRGPSGLSKGSQP